LSNLFSDIQIKNLIPPLILLAAVLTSIILLSKHMMSKLGSDFLKWIEDGEETDLKKMSRIERKLCPECENRMRENCPKQKCGKCGHELMKGDSEYFSYLNYIHKRYLFQTIPVCVALSFFPLIGSVIGFFYIRAAIINPFASYLPFGRRIRTQWLLKLIVLFLALFQLLPAYGAISIPLVAFIRYWFFMKEFRSLAEK